MIHSFRHPAHIAVLCGEADYQRRTRALKQL